MNDGAAATDGEKVTITDALPAGVTAEEIAGDETVGAFGHGVEGNALSCTLSASAPSCTTTGPLPPGDKLTIGIVVGVAPGTASPASSRVTVEGGGAATASRTLETAVSTQAAGFEPLDFSSLATGASGAPATQAGSHPYEITTHFYFPTEEARSIEPPFGATVSEVQDVKDISIDLPAGLIGDPQAVPRCPLSKLLEHEETSACPSDTQVGAIYLIGFGAPGFQPIFNLAPEAGYPAEFGFVENGKPIVMRASVRTGAGYGVQVTATGVPRVAEVRGAIVTFFGTPYTDPNISDRITNEHQSEALPAVQPFLTLGSHCGVPQVTTISVNSWQDPGTFHSASSESPPLSGCGALAFQPAIEVHPQASTRGPAEPAGYEVKLKVPQAEALLPTTPDLKDTQVTLPAGVSVSPSAANGLLGCAATGPEGINLTEEQINGAGHEDELLHAVPGHCPLASQIATVQIKTPLLQEELHGHVYLSQPQCGGTGQPACTEAAAEEGKLFGLYLEAEGSGVIVKLPGTVEAGGYGAHSVQSGLAPGQLRATFDENPQLPFSELTLSFNSGPRAPLANPQACGIYTTTSTLVPWSTPETPSFDPASAFAIAGCAGSTPFAPFFSSGTTSTGAGAFTNFSTTFSRTDGQQNLSGITLHTPPGLLGIIKNVAECPEAQANAGTCGPGSEIGTATVTAGAGTEPYTLHGSVYFTVPYKGAPFGLSIVVPAVAGPFNLGLEVVRAGITVNPTTAALTITSNPLPQYKDGVQLRLQTINVEVNRPDFMLNPTNCEQQAVTATISGSGGAAVPVGTPFATSGCASLPFSPKLTASTRAFTSPKQGSAFDVKIAYTGGQANIKRVDVTLPHKLSARLEPTLKNACSEAQFAANPAGCPTDSLAGTAKAVTPILDEPLEGPAIFVSHGGAKFPDLDLVLQGQGVTIVLKGNTEIKGKTTYSRFETVPDAPISSFELTLPEGEHSALSPNLPKRTDRSFCGSDLLMPTMIEGQNGAVIDQTTKVEVEGCKPALRIIRSKVKGDFAMLLVAVPAAGTLKAYGKDLTRATRKPGKAKDVSVRLKLTAKGRKLLAHGRKRRRKLTIKLAFTPQHGGRLTKQTTLAFTRRASTRKTSTRKSKASTRKGGSR
ncbi:MAG: hypothetical protein ACYCUM_12725 [Solirubrobacteraceae bacterium]